jgi:hypothetical protein
VHCEHQALDIGIPFLQNLDALYPALSWHANVHEHDVRGIVLNGGKGVIEPSVRADAYKSHRMIDYPLKAVPDFRIVIDNQNPNRLLLGFLFRGLAHR